MPMEGIKKNKPKYLKINDETKKVLEIGIILLLSVRLYCIHKQIIFQNKLFFTIKVHI